MALFCKVARLCQTRSRGLCQTAEVVPELGWNTFLESFEEHFNERGKALVPGLKHVITREIGLLKKELDLLKRETKLESDQLKTKAELESDLLKRETELDKKLLIADVASLKSQNELMSATIAGLSATIAGLREHRVRDQLETLRLKGLNDARGLFEKVQEVLALSCKKQGFKGPDLWVEILNAHPLLANCVEKHTKVRAADVSKQALHVYLIYTILSQHVHAGKELAELQVQAGGTILFQRGPMSFEQVRVFECLGDAAGCSISEDPATRPR